MNKNLLQDFNEFRKWFNKNFSLSLDGKFAGVGRLNNWEHFAYKLYKYLNKYYRKPLGDTIEFKVNGQKVKLYNH